MDPYLPGSPDTSFLSMLPQSSPSHVSARHGGWLLENSGLGPSTSHQSTLRATLPKSRSGYGGTDSGLGSLSGKMPQYREGMGEGFRATTGLQREVGLVQDGGLERDMQRLQQQTEEYQQVTQQGGQEYQREQQYLQEQQQQTENRNLQSLGLPHYNREEQLHETGRLNAQLSGLQQYSLLQQQQTENRNLQSLGLPHYNREEQLHETGRLNAQLSGLQQYSLLQQQHEQQQHEQQILLQQQQLQQQHNKRQREEDEEDEDEEEDQHEPGDEMDLALLGKEQGAPARTREIQRRRSSMWTHQEILLLIQEKRKNVERHRSDSTLGRNVGGEVKWAEVSKCLEGFNINKSLRMCKKKWESMVQHYRAISSYHEKGGTPTFWELDAVTRKARDLPTRFDLEVYNAMDEALKEIPPPTVPVQIVDTSAPAREDQMEEVAEQAFKEKTLRESQRKKFRQEQQDTMIAAFREMATTLCNTYASYEAQMSARQVQYWQTMREANEARAKEMNTTIMRAAEIYSEGLRELAEAFRDCGA
eukprot:TRINITY_DN668_c0_g11_i1.p1 TRINITY_DN668_c0_g11~~TRINITY_DN668_c0_g11_i1.p1  ORF type:complete len:532 (+),score=114.55 TRINITY_DN668_c0_g11_i1:373-1968(+)